MNIINAIINLVNNPISEITNYYTGRNRANNAGDALEEYVKDLFANSFNLPPAARNEKLSETFSYLGNNSNPPDAMLRGGDALEIKKIETHNASLALNSSYPKHTLRADSPMIPSACREAEHWVEKDMIYAVGIVHKNHLLYLTMVYGLDYCASEECYASLKQRIKDGVQTIPYVEFEETRELGRVNRVDPLGITYMRIRGMWAIENPWRVFNYIYTRPLKKELSFMCIINQAKWYSLDNTDELLALAEITPELEIENVRIKNPDNPAKLRNAKLITFSI